MLMKRTSTLFLKTVLTLIALAVLTFLIRFPQTEGRAAGLDLISVYTDPVILYIYLASTPFFLGLYQAFTLLGLIDKSKTFSSDSVKAVRNIKHYAVAVVVFTVLAEAYLFMFQRGQEDIAGASMMGFVIIFTSIVIAAFAAVFQKLLQNAVNIKHENDLTI